MAGKPAPLPSIERLRHLFAYDPSTGVLTRKIKRGSELAGAVVGTPNNSGRLVCRVDYRMFYVHRIAWLMHYGTEPPAIIDHKNGKPGDNRIANLRPATDSTNGANRNPNRNRTSGLRGVHWSKSEGRWRSSLRVRGRKLHLGWFDTREAAQIAYERAAYEHFGEYSYYRRDNAERFAPGTLS